MRQKRFIVCSFINIPLNVVTIDWEKRNWRRILTPEEEREIAAKMLRLNGSPDYNPEIERLWAASSTKKRKPTFRVKRIGSGNQLKAASSIQKEREKAEKALRLN
jgi:hypothetical protein